MMDKKRAKIVKKRLKVIKPIIVAVYFVVWTIAVLHFWLFLDRRYDTIGYTILYIYLAIPFVTFFISLLISLFNYGGKIKWIWIPIFGIMYMLLAYVTFSLGNNILSGGINNPDNWLLLIGSVISAVAMVIGHVVYLTVIRKLDVV